MNTDTNTILYNYFSQDENYEKWHDLCKAWLENNGYTQNEITLIWKDKEGNELRDDAPMIVGSLQSENDVLETIPKEEQERIINQKN